MLRNLYNLIVMPKIRTYELRNMYVSYLCVPIAYVCTYHLCMYLPPMYAPTAYVCMYLPPMYVPTAYVCTYRLCMYLPPMYVPTAYVCTYRLCMSPTYLCMYVYLCTYVGSYIPTKD
jgi:hypothetical protein